MLRLSNVDSEGLELSLKRRANRRTLSDEELVRLISSGDRAALVLLIRRYDQLLYRTARSILKDNAEAEDAVQEAYLLAYRGMAKFRHEAKLSTWLVRIAANVAMGRLRKNSRRASVIQLDDSLLQKMQDGNINPAEQPEEALSRADTRRLIEAKIDALPDAYRVVFVLRAVQELSVEETSEALGIPKATVRSRFFRARSLLRKALSKEVDVALGDVFPFAGARCDRMVDSVMTRLKLARSPLRQGRIALKRG
jgi:RNA polymerase sigma-70 factor (ECF subfamily)